MLSILSFFDKKDTILIGRSQECDYVIDDDNSVSRKHCIISSLPDNSFLLIDLDSRNGTYINNERVKGKAVIKKYDNIRLGRNTSFQIDYTAKPPTDELDATMISTLFASADAPADVEAPLPPPKPTVSTAEYSPQDSVDIFCLYHESDEEVCIAINEYLSALKRNDTLNISVSGKFEFSAGTDFVKAANEKIEEAEIILLFISADFIHSDALYKQSVKIIERYNEGKVQIVPIIAKFCLWDLTPFAKLSVLPSNQQPLKSVKHWPNPDEALTEVAKGIYQLVQSFSDTKADYAQTSNKFTTNTNTNNTNTQQAQTNTNPSSNNNTASSATQVSGASFEMPKPNIKLNTNWQISYQLKQFGRRLLANLIDSLLLGFLGGFFAGLFFDYQIESVQWEELTNILIIIFAFTVFTFMESSPWKGTPGKKIMGLQITNFEGERISFGKALIRGLAKNIVSIIFFLEATLVLVFVFFYMAYYFYKKEFLHDTITKTIISYKHSKT